MTPPSKIEYAIGRRQFRLMRLLRERSPQPLADLHVAVRFYASEAEGRNRPGGPHTRSATYAHFRLAPDSARPRSHCPL